MGSNGTLIEPRQGGVQSVIGWERLDKDVSTPDVQNPANNLAIKNNYKNAKRILEKNQDFIDLMQDFANPDDPNSENFGATKAGKYSKVIIEFEVLNRIEMEKRVGTADGVVTTEIYIDGNWQDITIYNTIKNLSIKNICTQTRIIVILENVERNPKKIESLNGFEQLQIETETGKLRPYPSALDVDNKQLKLAGAKETVKPIRVLTHEICIHALSTAERLSKFQTAFIENANDSKNQEIAFATLCNSIKDAIGEIGAMSFGNSKIIYSKEHQAISGINSTTGEKLPYNNDYERVNDATYELLKNETEKVLRVKMKSDVVGTDENSVLYRAKNQQKGQDNRGEFVEIPTIEEVSMAEAFKNERLTERLNYANIGKDKEAVNKAIQTEFEEIKANNEHKKN